MNPKYDWDAIEREYYSTTISLRALAAKHGVKNHSVIMSHSKNGGWAKKRADFQAGATNAAVVYTADLEGMRRAQEMRVRDHAIEAIDDAIQKLRSDMKLTRKELVGAEWVEVPVYLLKPADIVMLIDRMQVLFNRPSQITEERNLGINFSAGGSDPELLRGIIEATRGIVDTGGAAQSPIPRIDRAREN